MGCGSADPIRDTKMQNVHRWRGGTISRDPGKRGVGSVTGGAAREWGGGGWG